MFAEGAKRALIAILLFGLLQEVKLGSGGLAFPEFESSDLVTSTGMPFVQEYAVLATLCAFALGLLAGQRRDRRLSVSQKIALLGGLWAIVVIAVCLLLEVPVGDGAWGNVRMLAEGLALFLVVSSLRWRQRELQAVIVLFIMVACFHAIVVYLSFANPGLLPFEVNTLIGGGEPRFSGLFLQPSRAGFMFAIALVFAATIAIHSGTSRAARTIGLIALPFLAAGLMLTQTRGTLLAAVAGITYALFTVRHIFRALVAVSLAMILIAIGGFSNAGIVRIGVSRFFDPDQRGTGRAGVFSFVGEMIARYPLGSGAGALSAESGGYGIPHAHNMYLQIAVMFGVPGLFLFLGFIAAVFVASGASLGRLGVEQTPAMVLSLRAGFVVCLVAFMTEPFLITNVGLWFWVIAGLLVAIRDECALKRPNTDPPRSGERSAPHRNRNSPDTQPV